MAFQRPFNELLNEILTAYRNQFGDSRITEGSVFFVKGSATASMLWGLYRTLERVADQIFVDSADRAHKERHAAEFGIVTAGRTDAQIVDDVRAAKSSKISGGNRYDYIAWAKEVILDDEYITWAATVPLARGEGTFDVVVVSSQGNGVASAAIRNKIYDHIQTLRPIGSGFSWGTRVCAIFPEVAHIRIRGTGTNWNEIATVEAIKSHVTSRPPGEVIRLSIITSIMHDYGAETAEVLHPLRDIVPRWDPPAALYGKFVGGDIDIAPGAA